MNCKKGLFFVLVHLHSTLLSIKIYPRIFIYDLKKTQHILTKSVDDTRLRRADMLEGRAAIQRDLDKPEKQPHRNLMPSSKSKS